MIIEMLTTIAGPNISASSGSEINVDEKIAVDLVSGGFARYCDKSTVKETASVAGTKKATKVSKKAEK